jgi:hypothetical protein
LRALFTSLSVAIFMIGAIPIYSELSRRPDIWWTPHSMMVPLPASGDRVEIYARGQPLGALLQAGRLRIADDGGVSVLATSDVGLRFNNWDRVRAARLPSMIAAAAACAIAAVMFLLVVTGRLVYRGETPAATR